MKNLTESSTFTASVSVPEDNVDLRTAASVETGFQALTNRTKWLNDEKTKKPATSTDNEIPRFDGTDGKILQTSGMRITDAGELEYIATTSRTLRVPRSCFMANAYWYREEADVDHMGVCQTGVKQCHIDLSTILRAGMVLKSVTLTGYSTAAFAAVGNQPEICVQRSYPTSANLSAFEHWDMFNDSTKTVTLTSPYTVQAGDDMNIYFYSGTGCSGANIEHIQTITIEVDDSGPRNF